MRDIAFYGLEHLCTAPTCDCNAGTVNADETAADPTIAAAASGLKVLMVWGCIIGDKWKMELETLA